MLRNPALVPLSHQHQHALALCVRIQRTPLETSEEVGRVQAEIARLFDQEIRLHFDAEERVLFPAAAQVERLRQLVDDLRRDHVGLRAAGASASLGKMSAVDARDFAARLSDHIRREERELFEGMQQLLPREQLAQLGEDLKAAFRAAGIPGYSCERRHD